MFRTLPKPLCLSTWGLPNRCRLARRQEPDRGICQVNLAICRVLQCTYFKDGLTPDASTRYVYAACAELRDVLPQGQSKEANFADFDDGDDRSNLCGDDTSLAVHSLL